MRRAAVLSSHVAAPSAAAAAGAAGDEPGPPVLYTVTDHVATITLNRPRNRNSMTPDVLQGLREAVARVQGDADVRCVVIAAKGSSWCAGADFKSSKGKGAGTIVATNRAPGIAGHQSPFEQSYGTYSNFLTVLDIPVPVVGALTGHAIGGGFGLALVCDIRVANSKSLYGSNFVRLGLHPGMATTYIVPRLMGMAKANEYLLTGRRYNGAEAATLGVANYACDGADAVLAKATELAREIASAAPLAVRWTKQSLTRHMGYDPRPAAWFEGHMQSRSFETQDNKEGVAALLQKREPRFVGR